MKRIMCLLVLFALAVFGLSGCTGETSINSEGNDGNYNGGAQADPSIQYEGNAYDDILIDSP